MASKYIINNGKLLMSSSVDFHFELAKDHSTTKGGGKFCIEGNNLHLYGASVDFGQAKIEDVKEALKNEIVQMKLEKYNVFYSQELTLERALQNGVKIKDIG